MLRPLLSPSAFWIAVRRLVSLRFLLGLCLMVVALEVVARLSPLIVGRSVDQPFLVSTRVCEIDCSNQGKKITWIANERGTRGDLYHGQPVRIAILGSSTTAGSLLDQQQTWPEQFKSAAGTTRVHVDNYARDGATDRETTQILDSISTHGPRYDALLIMMHLGTGTVGSSGNAGAGARSAFRYWGQWVPAHPQPIVGPSLLRRRVRAQLDTEPRLRAVWNWVSAPFRSVRPPTEGRPVLSRSNRLLRNTGQVELVDIDISFTAAEVEMLRSHTRRMLAAAKATGSAVYLILQPVAYDEDEVPEVAAKWYTLHPVDDRPNTYVSNRSYAEGIRQINRIMQSVAEEMDLAVIDLDSALRPLLRERGDLFDDKWHFAPPGAAVAGKFLAREIEPDFPLLAHAMGPHDNPSEMPAQRTTR